jgi:hypothetical protein
MLATFCKSIHIVVDSSPEILVARELLFVNKFEKALELD